MTAKQPLQGPTSLAPNSGLRPPPTKSLVDPRRLWNGRTRLILFVFGGLLALGRSDALDPTKLAYLAVVLAVVFWSAFLTWQNRGSLDLYGMKPWIAISIAIAVMLVISLPVAFAHGVSFAPWLRGAAPYGLFAAAPFVALDARRSISTREALGWMTLAAALAAISFSIYWLEHRHIADFGIQPLVLPSAQLADAGFAVTVAFAFRSRRAGPWALVAGSILGALLVTGSRTTFLLFAVAAILAVVAGRSRWRQIGTAVMLGAAAAAMVVLLTVAVLTPGLSPGPANSSPPAATRPESTPGSSPIPSTHETPRPDLIGEHLGSIWTVFSDGGSGQSLRERIVQTETAYDAFTANPFLGAGPGKTYIWTNSSGRIVESSNLDTPLMIAAEFGLAGILLVFALVAVFGSFIRVTSRATGPGPEHLSVVGLAATFGLTGLLGPPMDDKGAAYALALVLTIALSAAGHMRADVER